MHSKFVKLLSPTICVAALAGLSVSTAGAATFKVDCDKGGPSIQDRIDNNASPGDTIEVSGSCTESVVLTLDGLRLVGVGGTTNPNGSGLGAGVAGGSGIVGAPASPRPMVRPPPSWRSGATSGSRD